MSPPPWFADWVVGHADEDPEGVAWLRSRPPAVQALAIMFPPSSVVRVVDEPETGCDDLAPGTYAIVSTYFSDGRSLSVRLAPKAGTRHRVAAADLEIVEYWRGWTPDRVREVISRK